jgi:hypothetical protein
MIGALAMAAFGILTILCFSVWLPLATFSRNPLLAILGLVVPPIGILYGLFNFDVVPSDR